ncbi:MAG: hypothetical protein P8J87_03505, partial [Verrucomicrobiales bacterium]|nr:hypothetical protein [Verrucomicrobiales bacterium]
SPKSVGRPARGVDFWFLFGAGVGNEGTGSLAQAKTSNEAVSGEMSAALDTGRQRRMAAGATRIEFGLLLR